MTRVLVVDDHETVLEGLRIGFEVEGFDTVVSSGDPEEVRRLLATFDPDVVVLDLDLGRHGSAADLIADIDAAGAGIVVLTGETDSVVLAKIVAAGAAAIIDKAVPFESLVREILAVEGGRVTNEGRRRLDEIERDAGRVRSEQAARLEPFRRLTAREAEVLRDLVMGRTAADIAESSYVSLSTVRSQIHSILLKLGVHSQLAAVSMAIRAGAVERGTGMEEG